MPCWCLVSTLDVVFFQSLPGQIRLLVSRWSKWKRNLSSFRPALQLAVNFSRLRFNCWPRVLQRLMRASPGSMIWTRKAIFVNDTVDGWRATSCRSPTSTWTAVRRHPMHPNCVLFLLNSVEQDKHLLTFAYLLCHDQVKLSRMLLKLFFERHALKTHLIYLHQVLNTY